MVLNSPMWFNEARDASVGWSDITRLDDAVMISAQDQVKRANCGSGQRSYILIGLSLDKPGHGESMIGISVTSLDMLDRDRQRTMIVRD